MKIDLQKSLKISKKNNEIYISVRKTQINKSSLKLLCFFYIYIRLLLRYIESFEIFIIYLINWH